MARPPGQRLFGTLVRVIELSVVPQKACVCVCVCDQSRPGAEAGELLASGGRRQRIARPACFSARLRAQKRTPTWPYRTVDRHHAHAPPLLSLCEPLARQKKRPEAVNKLPEAGTHQTITLQSPITLGSCCYPEASRLMALPPLAARYYDFASRYGLARAVIMECPPPLAAAAAAPAVPALPGSGRKGQGTKTDAFSLSLSRYLSLYFVRTKVLCAKQPHITNSASPPGGIRDMDKQTRRTTQLIRCLALSPPGGPCPWAQRNLNLVEGPGLA